MNNVAGVYAQGALTGQALQDAIQDALAVLASNDTTLADAGLTADDVRGVGFRVREEAGFDPDTIKLVVETVGTTVGSSATYDAGKYATKKVWSAIIRQVRKRRGSDALGEEQQEEPPEQRQ